MHACLRIVYVEFVSDYEIFLVMGTLCALKTGSSAAFNLSDESELIISLIDMVHLPIQWPLSKPHAHMST